MVQERWEERRGKGGKKKEEVEGGRAEERSFDNCRRILQQADLYCARPSTPCCFTCTEKKNALGLSIPKRQTSYVGVYDVFTYLV